MACPEFSPYQRGVIKRYYENLDGIALQRLQELVTDLYLARNSTKQNQLWQQVEKALKNLKVKPGLRDHIMSRRDVKILAANLQDWLKQAPKK